MFVEVRRLKMPTYGMSSITALTLKPYKAANVLYMLNPAIHIVIYLYTYFMHRIIVILSRLRKFLCLSQFISLRSTKPFLKLRYISYFPHFLIAVMPHYLPCWVSHTVPLFRGYSLCYFSYLLLYFFFFPSQFPTLSAIIQVIWLSITCDYLGYERNTDCCGDIIVRM